MNLQNIIEGGEISLNDLLITRLGLIRFVTISVPTIDHSSMRDSSTYASKVGISASILEGYARQPQPHGPQ